MFTRAVISDEISQDLELAAAMAARYGLDQLEMRTAWDVRIDNMDAAALRRVKEIAARHGLGIVGLASPFLKCDLGNQAEYAEHLEILYRCIAAARALDTNLIRVFTFWKKGGRGGVTPPLLADHFDEIVAQYREPAAVAEREGVILGVENEPACYVGTGHELARFVAAVGSPAVRAVWDPGNAYWTGQEQAFPDGYEAVKPYIAHVHLKDVVRQHGELEACVLGEGEVNILGQLQALARDGYTGCASLETHYRIKKALTEAEVVRPGGSAFSEGGEEASELCLVSWNKMMKQVRAGA